MGSINSEADRLFKALFEYAGETREGNVCDFTEIVSGFYRKLNTEYDNGKNSLTRRVTALIRHYVETDPRYQSRIDRYTE